MRGAASFMVDSLFFVLGLRGREKEGFCEVRLKHGWAGR